MKQLSVIFVLLVAACSNKSEQPPAPAPAPSQAPAKDPATAKKLISSGATVIDVRTADEYADGHVQSAMNIPVQDLPARLAEVEKLVAGDKTKPVVVYCSAGKRAAKAKTALEGAGYTNVVNGGGYDDLQ
jgi:phage shock protein E